MTDNPQQDSLERVHRCQHNRGSRRELAEIRNHSQVSAKCVKLKQEGEMLRLNLHLIQGDNKINELKPQNNRIFLSSPQEEEMKK